ncbi:MAG: 4-(cytidine 5'-diphospho)-2-C-methyl-D-erythritol kinase [Spirochaetes bacterium GWF1_51_8]|nr:MAG: 4-(cytidine 5'-diphospho)-2-C-methyl-D-erythritol kinase [Spirochaetes bacterium GWF1_51_8]
MRLESTAKLNLFLDITGKDPSDGYHFIDSVFQEISLSDTITIEKDTSDTVVFSGMDVAGTDTTVHKAVRLFKERFGVRGCFRVEVEKRIPMGAGLGGGSSNAAFTLMGLGAMAGIPYAELEMLGAKIGSDVPFFFHGGLCRVTGKGELIEKLPGRLEGVYFIVVYPDIHVSTAKAYSLIDSYGKGLETNEISKKSALDIDFLRKIMYNRFESKIFTLEEKLSALKQKLDGMLGARGSLMSGSGSSLFFMFDDEVIRDENFERLKKQLNCRFFRCNPVYR